MSIWHRLRATPAMEWSDRELAGLLLAIAVQGERQNPNPDPTVAAALREASRRLGGRDVPEERP